MNNTNTEKSRTYRHGMASMCMRFCGMMFARLFFAVGFALILAVVVVWLWNWLMPGLFGLGPIAYWQAFGLMILARLILGTFGLGFHGYRWHDRRPWGDRFAHYGHMCGDMGRSMDSNRTMKWWHNYKEFWRDEGKAAFEEYTKRAGKEGPEGGTDKK